MSDPRDKRLTKTPPPSIAEQIAAKLNRRGEPVGAPGAPTNIPAQDRENVSTSDLADPGEHSWDKPTPVQSPRPQTHGGESIMERVERRSGETKNTALDTLSRVEALRSETREDMASVRREVGLAHGKIDGVISVVADLRVEVGKGSVQNQTIIEMLDEQRETAKLAKQEQLEDAKRARQNTETVETVSHVADVEIRRTRQLGELEIEKAKQIVAIQDEAQKKAVRRELYKTLAVRVIAVIGGIWAVISTALIAKC